MRRLTGVVDSKGNFRIGKPSVYEKHSGHRDEAIAMQAHLHAAELQQPFKPDGTPNEAYTTLYHEQAIKQGIIAEDAVPDFQKFE